MIRNHEGKKQHADLNRELMSKKHAVVDKEMVDNAEENQD